MTVCVCVMEVYGSRGRLSHFSLADPSVFASGLGNSSEVTAAADKRLPPDHTHIVPFPSLQRTSHFRFLHT